MQVEVFVTCVVSIGESDSPIVYTTLQYRAGVPGFCGGLWKVPGHKEVRVDSRNMSQYKSIQVVCMVSRA